jgi:hypothetical protein
MTMTRNRPITFAQALRRLPGFAWNSYDPEYHKRPVDLAWIVLHEIDLYEEGQDGAEITSGRQVAQGRKYIAWVKGGVA